MSFSENNSFLLFKTRRDQIIRFLKEKNTNLDNGVVIIYSDFECDRYVFRQESSFYYLTGINEPGAVLLMYLDGRQILYIPNYGGIREKWCKLDIKIDDNVKNLSEFLCFDEIKYLGNSINGYSFNSIFTKEKYSNFLLDIEFFLNSYKLKEFFTLLDLEFNSRYFTQIQLYKNLFEIFPETREITSDLAPLIHYMRRSKSEVEIDLIYKAVQVTNMAHDSAAKVIAPG
ncbi:aminopeptidase P N-terminal domain-containing protein, partial [Candidatus Dependentiae bacterium]|nr:aminopeptidase P N-terminal domain-containing protein [Candidatus Dependentiae bacterium]